MACARAWAIEGGGTQEAGAPGPDGPSPAAPETWAATLMGYLGLLGMVGGPAMLVALWAMDVIRPGSFRRAGTRDVLPFAWWAWSLAWLAVFAGMTFGAGACAGAILPPTLPDEPPYVPELHESVLIGACAYVAAGIVAGVMLVGLSARSPKAGLGASWRGAWLGLAGFALALPVVQGFGQVGALIELWTHGPRDERIVHELLEEIVSSPDRAWAIAAAGLAIIGAPVIEEIMYRGFLQAAVLRATRSAWASVLLTSTVFALMHLGSVKDGAVGAIVTIFGLGLALGVAYERTRSLATPIVMHMAYNAANVALALALGT